MSRTRKGFESLLCFVVLGCSLAATQACARQMEGSGGAAISETLLQTTQAWDGTTYRTYGIGRPEITVLRIYIPPRSSLPWHTHPVVNAGYVLTGKLFVEKQGSGAKRELSAGEVLPEMVDGVHRGYTEDQSATLLVFYAGIQGKPLTELEQAAPSTAQ